MKRLKSLTINSLLLISISFIISGCSVTYSPSINKLSLKKDIVYTKRGVNNFQTVELIGSIQKNSKNIIIMNKILNSIPEEFKYLEKNNYTTERTMKDKYVASTVCHRMYRDFNACMKKDKWYKYTNYGSKSALKFQNDNYKNLITKRLIYQQVAATNRGDQMYLNTFYGITDNKGNNMIYILHTYYTGSVNVPSLSKSADTNSLKIRNYIVDMLKQNNVQLNTKHKLTIDKNDTRKFIF